LPHIDALSAAHLLVKGETMHAKSSKYRNYLDVARNVGVDVFEGLEVTPFPLTVFRGKATIQEADFSK